MLRLTAAVLLLAPTAAFAEAQPPIRPTLAYEVGPAFIAQNDGRYGAMGSPYEADDVGQRDNLVNASRASLELAIGRHTVILLYAPFEVTTQVRLEQPLQFRDELFTTGTVVNHRYLFDGYRASYLYRVVDGGTFALELGGSLQIRNADVAFASVDGMQRAHQDDIGLVGAAKARAWYRPYTHGPWGALEADGFSTFGLVDGVSGGIYDVQLMLGQRVGRGVDIVLGARLLGGGADVRDQNIYNWANFVAFTAGVRIELDTLVGATEPRRSGRQ